MMEADPASETASNIIFMNRTLSQTFRGSYTGEVINDLGTVNQTSHIQLVL
jgi:hypothetical protein